MNINEFLATEVMGWHVEQIPISNTDYYVDEQGGGKGLCSDWHPDTSIEQALMCADKFDIYWIDKSPQKPFYRVQVGGEGGETIISHADNLDKLPLAICEAIREVING